MLINPDVDIYIIYIHIYIIHILWGFQIYSQFSDFCPNGYTYGGYSATIMKIYGDIKQMGSSQ